VTRLILVDPVDDEEVVELLQRLTMRDLNKRKELLTLIRSTLLLIITFYIIGLSIELIISDHRLTSVCQLDLQEASKLALKFSSLCCRNILESF
jgi:hypothetical protein